MSVKMKIRPLNQIEPNAPQDDLELLAGDGALAIERPTASDPTLRVYVAKGRAKRMRRFARQNGLSFNAVVRIVLAETIGRMFPGEVPRLRGAEETFIGGAYKATAGPDYACQCPVCTRKARP